MSRLLRTLLLISIMTAASSLAGAEKKTDGFFSGGYTHSWVTDDTLSGSFGMLDVQLQKTSEEYRTFLGNWSHFYMRLGVGYGATNLASTVLDTNSFVIDLQLGFPWQVLDNHWVTGGAGLLVGSEIGPLSCNHAGLGLLSYAHLFPDAPVSLRLQHEWKLAPFELSSGTDAKAYEQRLAAHVALGNFLVGSDLVLKDEKHSRFGVSIAYGAIGRK